MAMASSSIRPQIEGHFRFLALPLELRLEIYDLASDQFCKLRQVNKQIEQEAIEAFCSRNVLHIRVQHDGLIVHSLGLRYKQPECLDDTEPTILLQQLLARMNKIEIVPVGAWKQRHGWFQNENRSKETNERQYRSRGFFRITDNLRYLVRLLNGSGKAYELKIEVDYGQSPHIAVGDYEADLVEAQNGRIWDTKRLLLGLKQVRNAEKVIWGPLIYNEPYRSTWRDKLGRPERGASSDLLDDYKEKMEKFILTDRERDPDSEDMDEFAFFAELVALVEGHMEFHVRWMYHFTSMRANRWHGEVDKYNLHQEAVLRDCADVFKSYPDPAIRARFRRVDRNIGNIDPVSRTWATRTQAYADMRQGEIDTWDEMRSLAGETDMEEEAEQLGWDQYEDLDLDKLWEPRDEDGHTAPIEGEDPDWGLQELLGESEDPSET